jgi:hypothetical protein
MYQGQLVATPTSAVDGIYELEGTCAIIGGTRRFERAVGSGIFTGTDNILTHAVALSLTGTIVP